MQAMELPPLFKETEEKYEVHRLPEYIITDKEVKDEKKANSYRDSGYFVVEGKVYSLPPEVPAAGLASSRWDDDEIVEYYLNYLIRDFIPIEKKKFVEHYIDNPLSIAKTLGPENIILRVFGKESMKDKKIYEEKVKDTDQDKLRGLLPAIWAEYYFQNPFYHMSYSPYEELKEGTTAKDIYLLCIHGFRDNPKYKEKALHTWGKWSELVGHTDDPLIEKYRILSTDPEMETRLRRETMELLAAPIAAGTILGVGTLSTALLAQTDVLKWGLKAGFEAYKHTGVTGAIPALAYGAVAIPGFIIGGTAGWLVYNILGKMGGEKISEGKIRRIEEDKSRVRTELEKDMEIYQNLADSYYRMLRALE